MTRPQLFGSKEIIQHLFSTYGPGKDKIPSNLLSGGGGLKLFGSGKGAKIRSNARPDAVKFKPITIYGWEGAPYVTQVRETLTELGLSHLFVNCANGSANREALLKKKGTFQVVAG